MRDHSFRPNLVAWLVNKSVYGLIQAKATLEAFEATLKRTAALLDCYATVKYSRFV